MLMYLTIKYMHVQLFCIEEGKRKCIICSNCNLIALVEQDY